MPKEETFPIPMKYTVVMRSTRTDLDVMQENVLTIIGMLMKIEDSQIRSWTGFTKFTLLKEAPPKGYMWSGRETDKISDNDSTRSYLAGSVGDRGYCCCSACAAAVNATCL